MRDEAGGTVAFAHLLVALPHGIDVHQAIIGAHRQERTIRGELELVNDFLPVLDVHHLCHVPENRPVSKEMEREVT